MRPNLLTDTIATDFSECTWRTAPLQQGWPSFSAIHYNDDEAYDQYLGTDLTPYIKFPPSTLFIDSNARMFDENFPPQIAIDYSGLKKRNETHSYSFCALDLPDESRWHVQRVGPFITYGNFSWTSFVGRDALALAEPTASIGPVVLLEHINTGVDAAGGIISNPPLHMHHIHLQRRADDGFSVDTPLPGPYLFNRPKHLIIERHAESAYCPDGPFGTALCHPEGEEPGYGRAIDRAMEFDSEINDVRAPGSAPLVWYFQLAMRWRPADGIVKPTSFMGIGIAGPSGVRNAGKKLEYYLTQPGQKSLGAYAWIPTDGPYLAWSKQTYISPRASGKLVRLKHHDHMNLMYKNILCYAPITVKPWEACGLRGNFSKSLMEAQMFGRGTDPTNPTGSPWDMSILGMPFTVTPQLNLFQGWMLPLKDMGFATFDDVEAELDPETIMCTSTRRYNADPTGHTVCRDEVYLKEGWQIQTLLFLEYPADYQESFFATRPSFLPLHSGWFLVLELTDPPDMSCYHVYGMEWMPGYSNQEACMMAVPAARSLHARSVRAGAPMGLIPLAVITAIAVVIRRATLGRVQRRVEVL